MLQPTTSSFLSTVEPCESDTLTSEFHWDLTHEQRICAPPNFGCLTSPTTPISQVCVFMCIGQVDGQMVKFAVRKPYRSQSSLAAVTWIKFGSSKPSERIVAWGSHVRGPSYHGPREPSMIEELMLQCFIPWPPLFFSSLMYVLDTQVE